MRAGRIDAYVAGAYGTPQPQQDISTLIESFSNQGFNQSEMIKLVACGHTMGGVRSTDFPELVAPNPSITTPVFDNFDETMQFDNLVLVTLLLLFLLEQFLTQFSPCIKHRVTDYLNNKSINVLVTTTNQTMASDLRVFASDGNVTMRR
jgi:Peroxidase